MSWLSTFHKKWKYFLNHSNKISEYQYCITFSYTISIVRNILPPRPTMWTVWDGQTDRQTVGHRFYWVISKHLLHNMKYKEININGLLVKYHSLQYNKRLHERTDVLQKKKKIVIKKHQIEQLWWWWWLHDDIYENVKKQTNKQKHSTECFGEKYAWPCEKIGICYTHEHARTHALTRAHARTGINKEEGMYLKNPNVKRICISGTSL